jgi:hypothetical protein
MPIRTPTELPCGCRFGRPRRDCATAAELWQRRALAYRMMLAYPEDPYRAIAYDEAADNVVDHLKANGAYDVMSEAATV